MASGLQLCTWCLPCPEPKASFLSMEQISTLTQFFVGHGELGEIILCALSFWRFAGVEGEGWRDIVSRLVSLFNTLTYAAVLQDLIQFIGLHLMTSGPSYLCGIKLICGFFVSLQLCSVCPPARIMFFPSLR